MRRWFTKNQFGTVLLCVLIQQSVNDLLTLVSGRCKYRTLTLSERHQVDLRRRLVVVLSRFRFSKLTSLQLTVIRMIEGFLRFPASQYVASHDIRGQPIDHIGLEDHSCTVSLVHSHVRSNLAYSFSCVAQRSVRILYKDSCVKEYERLTPEQRCNRDVAIQQKLSAITMLGS